MLKDHTMRLKFLSGNTTDDAAIKADDPFMIKIYTLLLHETRGWPPSTKLRELFDKLTAV